MFNSTKKKTDVHIFWKENQQQSMKSRGLQNLYKLVMGEAKEKEGKYVVFVLNVAAAGQWKN